MHCAFLGSGAFRRAPARFAPLAASDVKYGKQESVASRQRKPELVVDAVYTQSLFQEASAAGGFGARRALHDGGRPTSV